MVVASFWTLSSLYKNSSLIIMIQAIVPTSIESSYSIILLPKDFFWLLSDCLNSWNIEVLVIWNAKSCNNWQMEWKDFLWTFKILFIQFLYMYLNICSPQVLRIKFLCVNGEENFLSGWSTFAALWTNEQNCNFLSYSLIPSNIQIVTVDNTGVNKSIEAAKLGLQNQILAFP